MGRPLPLTVKANSWAAIVETLLGEGEVIRNAVPSLNRVTFTRRLTAESAKRLCDMKSTQELDADWWPFRAGTLDVAVWLDEEPGADEAQLRLEGRCQVTFNPPKARYLLAPWPLAIIAAIATGGQAFEPRSVPLTSTGELERDLQEKIVTTLGLEMPRWLGNPR